MAENILISVVFGLGTAGLLELWRRMRAKQEAQFVRREAVSDEANGMSEDATGKTVLRLLLATIIGFFLGGVTAGILEAIGVDPIEFGSLLANTLIAVWTGLVWWLLSGAASSVEMDASPDSEQQRG